MTDSFSIAAARNHCTRALVAVCVVAYVGATACTRQSTSAKDKAELRIGVGVGASARETGISVLTDQLYSEPLIGLDVDGRPAGRLAKRWNWEADGRLLRIDLMPGTKLHDGRTLDAALARRFLLAAIASWRRNFRGAFDGITGIDAPDAGTLRIHLREPDAFLVMELNNAQLVDPDNTDIGTGPFKLVRRNPVDALRFDQFHDGVPSLERIQIATFDSQRAAWSALMRNEVDALPDVARDSIRFLEQTSAVRTFASLRPFYWALSFNLRHSMLKRPEVRRALSAAINRDEIVKTALKGYATVATDPVWPLHWAYPQMPAVTQYDPGRATAVLNPGGAPRGKRARFKIRCLFYGEDPQLERIALMVQRQLSAADVDLDLEPVRYEAMVKRLASGDFDAFLTQMQSGRAVDWTYRFWHSPAPGEAPILSSGYTGADEVLDRLRHAYADDEVRRGMHELRQKFHDDVPAVFIAWLQMTRAVNSRFEVGDARKYDVFGNVWQWRLAGSGN